MCWTAEPVASIRCSDLAPTRTSARPVSAPGWPIQIEVHCADGNVALVRGIVDRVPWLAGENAQRVVIVDAVAKPLPADVRDAAA
jgi:hypothetical protein